ncbi:MAG TPA: 1-(5-phosphoribosyl)-5-[(5-phosphoribosylamino)methylideneamino]imidazole-4-carboxamide isomerase [Clostridiales bacterium]|nr:1-(5-phosphoribosyl)-5-[(5-phosphoribosylamino)methylideneamino]imidazole-4-carboxamide isomerase [Clostridiales bacterium]
MIIYPAVDIKNGNCVMLQQGKPESKTIYGNDPVEIALKWQNEGAEYIHIVDLDGAIYGEDRGNLSIIEDIREKLTIPIQVGGGVRDTDKIAYLLDEVGIDRVIVGTLAIEAEDIVADMAKRYPGKIAVSIDAKNGLVAIKGWTEGSTIDAIELCSRIENMGIDTVIYTDITRDGMLKGPNIEFSKKLIETTDLDVIISGGITSIADIRDIANIGAAGAIIGKGLYSGQVNLIDAIQAARGVF